MSPFLLLVVLVCLGVGGGCVAFGLVYGLWHTRVWRLAVLVWAAALAAWVVVVLTGMAR